MNFETLGDFLYITRFGTVLKKLNYTSGVFTTTANIFKLPTATNAYYLFTPVGAPSGYQVDYYVTYVQNGEESTGLVYNAVGSKLPVAAGQSNYIEATLLVPSAAGVTEMRVYRRPATGGAFGYLGSSTKLFVVAGNLHGSFEDYGSGADYSIAPPSLITRLQADPSTLLSKTVGVYQQRLIITDINNLEALLASRPGYQNNFQRDYPLTDASALKFKSGAAGHARVLRMIEADGLVVFTTIGVFLHQGALTPDNLALVKKGKWVINASLEPIAIPGGLIFIDAATNTVRNLVLNQTLGTYNAEELSIFSGHLFAERTVTSWAFQEGNFPILWVTFDDGTYASFTYEQDQEMRAWTRHDSVTDVEQVCGTGVSDLTLFVVKQGTSRYIEVTLPRRVPAAVRALDPEADKNPSCAYMDSVRSYNGLMNGSLVGTDVFTLVPVTPDDWEGELTLTCGTSAIFVNGGSGTVGEVLRVFNGLGTFYDLEVTARTSDNEITVLPSIMFPVELETGFRLYRTVSVVGGLGHLLGESPSVIVDGAVVCSPNNDIDDYPEVTVVPHITGGAITLPDSMRGAIVHVGRPVPAGDIETLDIDTVEQSPVLLESLTVNKLYIKTKDSSGLYVGHRFPSDDKVEGMQPLDDYTVDYEESEPIVGNRYKPPLTRRAEVTLPGDWRSQGKIKIRQVDPLHFEILSIIPDVEVLGRGK